MKIRSIAVNQFKKFTTPMCLDDIGDGLNVVVGPNEMGKSTLLDALRAVLLRSIVRRRSRLRLYRTTAIRPRLLLNWRLRSMMGFIGSESGS